MLVDKAEGVEEFVINSKLAAAVAEVYLRILTDARFAEWRTAEKIFAIKRSQQLTKRLTVLNTCGQYCRVRLLCHSHAYLFR